MSGVSRLRRIFSAKPSIRTTSQKHPVTAVHRDDYSTPQGLRNVVDNFKKSCQSRQFRRNANTYDSTVRRLSRAQAFPMIEDILDSQKQYNEISSEGFVVRLITLYGKARMFDHALALFHQMPSLNCPRSVKSLAALLNASLAAKRHDVVLDLFRQLPPQCSIQPDVASYNVVIRAFCETGSTDPALSMLREMEELGLKPDQISFNTLLRGFYKKRGCAEGDQIWALMRAQNNFSPDAGSYKLRLSAMIVDGRVTEAVKVVVDEMRASGVEPDVRCFNVLIKCFCSDGKLEEAKYWYDELVGCGCVADQTTYVTLVPFVFEKRDFEMALKLCKAAMSGGRLLIEVQVLKRVVEGFVAEGMIGEAAELVVLAKKNNLQIDLPP